MPAATLNEPVDESVARLTELFRPHAFSLSDEKVMQNELEVLLANASMTFKREYRLSGSDRVDFFMPGSGIAIECKLRAPRMSIYRQLKRYAQHDSVQGLLLVTNTAMGLPSEILDTPTFYLSLGAAWL